MKASDAEPEDANDLNSQAGVDVEPGVDLSNQIEIVVGTGSKSRQASRKKSSGPRTPVGKRISSRNARKCGFFSREFRELHLDHDEDRREYSGLFERLIQSRQPVGEGEFLLVEMASIHLHQYKALLRLVKACRSSFGAELGTGLARFGELEEPMQT